jgi:hypothetical protein
MGSLARVRAHSSDDNANHDDHSAANSFTKAPSKPKKAEGIRGEREARTVQAYEDPNQCMFNVGATLDVAALGTRSWHQEREMAADGAIPFALLILLRLIQRTATSRSIQLRAYFAAFGGQSEPATHVRLRPPRLAS